MACILLKWCIQEMLEISGEQFAVYLFCVYLHEWCLSKWNKRKYMMTCGIRWAKDCTRQVQDDMYHRGGKNLVFDVKKTWLSLKKMHVVSALLPVETGISLLTWVTHYSPLTVDLLQKLILYQQPEVPSPVSLGFSSYWYYFFFFHSCCYCLAF